MIKRIKYKKEEFSYPVFEYMYPYLLKLVWRGKLEVRSGNILVIPEKTSAELQGILETLMVELLDEFYIEPRQDDLLEYRGRYECIELADTEYTLDITANPKDRVVYQIFSLYDWIRKVSQLA